MTKTVCITNADWVVAWDAPARRHVYLRDADVAFRGSAIGFVGTGYRGAADETIDGRGLLVLPGFVNVHTHPASEPAYRGIREEHGQPEMYMSGLYERLQAYNLSADGKLAAAEVAYGELLQSGVTSVVDLSSPYPGWIDLAARSGLRAFLGPGYASARWRLARDHELAYDWDEEKGRNGFEAALALIAEAERHPSGRLSGIVYPAQIDTCSEALLRDSIAAARAAKRPFTTHAAQSVVEFQEMVRRHGKTPIQWADEIGILGPGTLLGHAIFTDGHSWLHWWSRDDVRLLADSGTSVAHCPSPFARYGQVLEHFGGYVRAGVNMGIGTDVAPHNIIEEMRLALVLARVAAEDIEAVATADVFHAATVGGADALLREDLGRLAPGAKADLVLVDARHPLMMPVRDPLRSLIYTAAERAVRDVYVDGVKVVADGKVLALDLAGAHERLAEAQARMEADAPKHDFKGRRSQEICPLALPLA